jgi:hypothetical protein
MALVQWHLYAELTAFLGRFQYCSTTIKNHLPAILRAGRWFFVYFEWLTPFSQTALESGASVRLVKGV